MNLGYGRMRSSDCGPLRPRQAPRFAEVVTGIAATSAHMLKQSHLVLDAWAAVALMAARSDPMR